jgi:H+/Cl- antiporter ClcA
LFDEKIQIDPLMMGKVLLACVAFGLAGYLFGELTHRIKDLSRKFIRNPFLVPLIGGAVVIGITFLFGNYDYNGLGVVSYREGGVSILSSFQEGGAHALSWLQKLVLTSVTLGTGFKGGEVTPLFFVGSTLGNVLGELMDAPIDLFRIGIYRRFCSSYQYPTGMHDHGRRIIWLRQYSLLCHRLFCGILFQRTYRHLQFTKSRCP